MQLYGSKDLGFRHWLPTNSSWQWTIESEANQENLDFPENLFDLKRDNEEDGISLAAMPLIVTVGVLVLFFAVLGVLAVGHKVLELVGGGKLVGGGGGGGGGGGKRCQCQLAEKDSLMASSEEDPINIV